jgi:superfamily II DNA or RNA helicase
MKGLYLISNRFYGPLNVIKFGYTTNLTQRFNNYFTSMGNTQRAWKFFSTPQLQDCEIYIIEQEILCKTINLSTDGNEIRENPEIIFETTKNILEEKNIEYTLFENIYPESLEHVTTTDKINFSLRDYQVDAIYKWNFTDGIICLATGLGKTLVGCGIISKFLSKNPEGKILWHTYFKDILISQWDDIKKYGCIGILPKNTKLNKYWEKINTIKNNSVTFINSGKLERILKNNQFDLIVTDECHDITADGTFDLLNAEKRKCIHLGLSATPIKKEKASVSRIVQLYDNNFIYTKTLLEAINEGYLTPFEFIWMKYKQNDENYIVEQVTKQIQKSSTKKIICWCESIEKAKNWEKNIKEKIDLPTFISESKNDQTCEKLNKFLKNDEGIIFVVNRFTQGTNDPKVDMGIQLDYIKDTAQHRLTQKLGRILRLYKGKNKAIFLDVYEPENEDKKIKSIIKKIINYCEELHPEFIKDFMENIMKDEKGISVMGKNGKVSIQFKFENENDELHGKVFHELMSEFKRKRGLEMTTKDFCILLENLGIFNEESYFEIKKENKKLPYNIKSIYSDFSWDMVKNPYYSKEECKQKICEITELHYEKIYSFRFDEELCFFLHNKDNKIPNKITWKYYGVKREYFFSV